MRFNNPFRPAARGNMIVDEAGNRVEPTSGMCVSYEKETCTFLVHRQNGERLYWQNRVDKDDKFFVRGDLSRGQVFSFMRMLAHAFSFSCELSENSKGNQMMVLTTPE